MATLISLLLIVRIGLESNKHALIQQDKFKDFFRTHTHTQAHHRRNNKNRNPFTEISLTFTFYNIEQFRQEKEIATSQQDTQKSKTSKALCDFTRVYGEKNNGNQPANDCKSKSPIKMFQLIARCIAVVVSFLLTLSHVCAFFSLLHLRSQSQYIMLLQFLYNLCNNISIIYHLFELSLNGNKKL